MTIDLRAEALAALEEAKRDLQRDGYLLAVALIFADGELLDFNLSFEGPGAKKAAYTELVRIAKEKGALAIITINDSRSRGGASGESRECLYMTVSGHGQAHVWTVCCYYERIGGQIFFTEQVESEGDILSLLPDWPR